jgi:hypothetical protein
MFESAKEYLARVVPWPQPGEPGFVNLHWTFPPTTPRPDGKAAWTGRAVTSVGDAAKALEFALKAGSNTLDVYACMSSQLNADSKTTKGKRPFTYNAPIRLASNALLLKSFFIDIDYGKPPKLDPVTNQLVPNPNGYDTAEEAIVNLMSFISKVGLPKPTMIVSSGGGFHVYWCVSSALMPHEWQPIAYALAEACKHHGLRCDTQCTVDSVRVLRIPDTFNRKQEPARHVKFIGPRLDFDYSLERISVSLTPYMGRVHAPISSSVDRSLFPVRNSPVGASELQHGLNSLWPDSDLDLVLPACGFLRDAVASGGAHLDNPLFNLVNLICTFTKGGRADAHRMAKGHPNYDPNSTYTDDFFDRKVRERSERGLGWPGCATISATGARACKSCSLLAHGKSPLNFEQPRTQAAPAGATGIAQQASQGTAAIATVTAQVSAGAFGAAQAQPVGQQLHSGNAPGSAHVTPQGNNLDLPGGYLRSASGIVSKVMVDPANPQQQITYPISDYPMLNAWLQTDPKILHFDSQVDINRVSQIDIELEVIGGQEMRKSLQRQGFMLVANDKHSGDFFVSWVKKLQSIKDSVASAPFGWQDKNGQTEGFIYGGQLWTPNGNSPSATANPVINLQYKPKGSDVYWLDAVKLVTSQGRPDLEAIVASAFAAPLVMSTGHLGMLMSAYSKESGIGKSTALRIAQAVWGDPIKAVQSLSDTQNSVMKKIGEVRSLPVYWDELKTDEDTKKFVNMTFQIAQGKEKSRLNQHAQMKEPGHWQTLVVSASNDSLLDHITQQTSTTLAGLYRIFEYTVKPVAPNSPGLVDTSEATIRLSKLNNNYGAVGLKYAAWLGSNFKQIEVDMAKLSKELNLETKSDQEERFWISLIACILLGARYSNMLGYSVFDEPALKQFMLTSLDRMRQLRGQQTVDLTRSINVSSIMAQFLKDMQKENKVIFTDRVHIAAGRPPAPNSPNAVRVLSPSDISRLNGIVVQIGRTDKIMRISSTAFGEWLKKQGKSRHLLMEGLHAAMTITHVVGFLGSGTGLAFSKENLLQIDLASSNELNFVDEVQ